MSSNPNNNLEPKFGWGCKEHHIDREAVANAVEKLEFDSSWRPYEVVRFISLFLKRF